MFDVNRCRHSRRDGNDVIIMYRATVNAVVTRDNSWYVLFSVVANPSGKRRFATCIVCVYWRSQRYDRLASNDGVIPKSALKPLPVVVQ